MRWTSLAGVLLALSPCAARATSLYEDVYKRQVQAYMVSRDAVAELARTRDLRAVVSRPGSDFLMRFPRPFEGRSFETLFRNYQRFVTVGYDSQTGISKLTVRAFRAGDAHTLADSLLDGGEAIGGCWCV